MLNQTTQIQSGLYGFGQIQALRLGLQALYQVHKRNQFAVFGIGGQVQQSLPQTGLQILRHRLHGFNAARTDAARRHVDDAQYRIVVLRVHGHAQIRQRVFDFLALIKAQATVNFIRHVRRKQRLLQHPRLRIAAVQHRHIVKSHAILHPCFGFFHHEIGFKKIGIGPIKTQFFTVCIGRFIGQTQIFAQTLFIVGD